MACGLKLCACYGQEQQGAPGHKKQRNKIELSLLHISKKAKPGKLKYNCNYDEISCNTMTARSLVKKIDTYSKAFLLGAYLSILLLKFSSKLVCL